MAEGAVTFVVKKLGDFLAQEATLQYGVRDQLTWVEAELRRMQCYLEDADRKGRNGDSRVKNWVREVIQVSYRAEDVIDTFILEVERHRRQRGLVGCIKRYTLAPAYRMIARHKVAMEIESIKSKVREISDSRITYGIANLGETGDNDVKDARVAARRRIIPDLNGDMSVIVGFDSYTNMLVDQLLDSNIKQKCVVSIVGMGGLGKTTLAEKVYSTLKKRSCFSTQVWATVSENFVPLELVKNIVREAMGKTKADLAKMEEDEMKRELHNFLRDRVYLIVLDDVWTPEVWQMMNTVLPNVKNGSRVMLTTRYENIAKLAVPNFTPFMLPVLSDDQSWELFTRRTFPESCFPEELVNPGRRMAAKCAGLPLALLVLSGFLSLKPPLFPAWVKVEKSLDWGSTGNQCTEILALSYKNLPHHYLKACFLYIASFPEDSTISAFEITRLWIAEGFIPQSDEEAPEDTAMEYLNELAQRSLIQVLKRKYDGGVSKFRIHDLLRGMCLREAKEYMFLHVVLNRSGETTSEGSDPQHNISNSRRLVLHTENCNHGSFTNLRSLFLRFDYKTELEFGILRDLKLMRVLDFYIESLDAWSSSIHEGTPSPSFRFPVAIKSMTQLRYLKLSMHLKGKFPSAIGNFRSLQTLDLTDCTGIIKLPKELGMLPNLRHCFLASQSDAHFPAIITTTRLQTLKGLHCDQRWAEESLSKLLNLRRLSIRHYPRNKNVLCDSILKLRRLVSLSLCVFAFPAEYMITNLSNNHHLQKLMIFGLWGPKPSLPDSNSFPPNLTKLILWRSGFEQDPMPVLEKLPNLLVLQLGYETYKGREMTCSEDGFPRLQALTFYWLLTLEDWTVAPGAFPNLTTLKIFRSTRLTTLPEGLKDATVLKELILDNGSAELVNNLRKDVGKDWHRIQHVPFIEISGIVSDSELYGSEFNDWLSDGSELEYPLLDE